MSLKKDPEIVRANNAARHKKWRLANPQRVRENFRRHYWKHRDEQTALGRQKYRELSEEKKKKYRSNKYQVRYGITVEDYDALFSKQGGMCAICGTTKSGKQGQHFAIDHDHSTGRVRGLLCIKCNGWLGWYEANQFAAGNYVGFPCQYYVLEKIPKSA